MRTAFLEVLRIGICLYIGVVYGDVLRKWFPAYEELSFGRKMSYALPALLALVMLADLMLTPLGAWSGDVRGAGVLSLLLLLSVLLWLRDLAEERD